MPTIGGRLFLRLRAAVWVRVNLSPCGPVAQLGARFHGMEEVKGSNPFRSTNLTPARRLSAETSLLVATMDQKSNHNDPFPAKVEITESVIFQKLNDEAVLLNLNTQDYYGLNDVGASMWNMLLEDGDVETVVGKLKLMYAAEENTLRSDLHSLIRELLDLGLLRAPSASAVQTT